MHGGAFYHAQKYKVAPQELPEPLHWFKWEAYFTWITGFLLLTVVYYLKADAFLINTEIADISVSTAVAASIGMIVAGWLVYNGLCLLNMTNTRFALLGAVLVLGLCWAVSQLYGGRGMFVQIGVMLGTIMVANVFFVIIPSQKQLVAAKLEGKDPDPSLGNKAKQRSLHNNYLTLPVVFVMISPHFAMTYGHAYNWLVLFVIFLVGTLIRHYFNLRNQGRHVVAIPIVAFVIAVALAAAITPRNTGGDGQTATFSEARNIIQKRCVACHSATPTHPTAPVTAAGVAFDSAQEISSWADKIHEQVVVTKLMPLANLTKITEEERSVLARWYASGAKTDE